MKEFLYKPDFQTLFESCPGLYLVLFPNTPVFSIVAVSNDYLQATKTKREDILGRGIFEVFPDNPNDPNATGERNLCTSLQRVILGKVADTMAVQKYDIRLPESEGGSFEERYWSPVNSPVLGPNREIQYIIHRVEDVTEFIRLKQKGIEQEKLTEELKEQIQRNELDIFSRTKERQDAHSSGQLARIILDRMYQFVGLLDAQGRFLEINQPALDGAGLKKTDVLGVPIWEVPAWRVTADNPKKIYNAYVRASKGEFVREEVDLFAAAGGTERITIDFSLMPIRDDFGRIAYYLGEGRNITEKKLADVEIEKKNAQLNQLNEKLQQLDQLKTKFFANVSHELRTPLTLILGPTEHLRDIETLSEEDKRSIDVILRNARLLLKHVNDLLDIARLEAGKMAPSYVEFNVGLMLKAIAGNFDSLACEKNILFGIDATEHLLLQADPNMVQRILLNLIGNAFKFTPEGGTICVSATEDGTHAFITVQDTGPGIPVGMREAIFERFRQGEDPLTKSFSGTGLGLSIAKEFVQLHKGSISVGEATGSGALFTVKLPLKAPAHAKISNEFDKGLSNQVVAQSLLGLKELAPKDTSSRTTNNAKGLILIVEDNPDLNRFLADILSKDFNVEVAFSGQEGLDKALKVKPDLILSDVMMPQMSGDQLVTQIRRHHQLDETAIILLTAKADDQMRIHLLKGGAQDYVLKPFFSEEVVVRVKNLVAIKKAREHLQGELETTERDIQMLTTEVTRSRQQLKLKTEELERVNAQLQENLQSRDEFLSIASHELKTPISALKLQLQLVDKQIKPQANLSPSPEVLKKSFDMSLKQVNIFVDLINELLDMSRIRLGKLVLHFSHFNLSDMVTQTFETFLPQFHAAKCAAELSVERDIEGEWDHVRVQEILANLFSNAIKYAPGQPVKVTARKSSEHTVVLTVEDEGPGIPEYMHAKIFERFGRIIPSGPRHVSGLGLGLFIVKSLIEAHQGTIKIESLAQGTKFIVELPLSPQVVENKGVSNGVI